MAQVRAAAATDDVHPWQPVEDVGVLPAQLARVPVVQRIACIEFGVAAARRVAAQAANSPRPVSVVEHVEEITH